MSRYRHEYFYGLGVQAVHDSWSGEVDLMLVDDFGNLVEFVSSPAIRHEDI